ncbi:MAG: pilin, partial [Patescibacteria group bacterium]
DINYTPQISIGGGTIKNLGDYIAQIYTYSLGFVAMLAVIMLMVGGLQLVMARGGPGVGAAKKRIGNAILGVVILSAAYLILNTISPAIVKLSLPRIPKIKPQKFTFSEKFGQQMDKNDICYTIRDKDICGSGMQCVPLRTIDQLNSDDMPCGQIMKANEAIVAVGVALISGGAGGSASTLAATAKTAGQVALKGGGKIIGFVSRYPKTTVAALLVGTGYVKATAPDPAWGEEGRCWPLTTGTVPKGYGCAMDVNCANGLKCVKVGTCINMGICSTVGTVNSVCNDSSPCTDGSKCLMYTGNAGRCSNGGQGNLCQSKSDCAAGSQCNLVGGGAGNFGYCGGAQKTEGACTNTTECAGGATCIKPFGKKGANDPGICSAGTAGEQCYDYSQCKPPAKYCLPAGDKCSCQGELAPGEKQCGE